MQSPDLFNRFQEIEFLSLVASGAGAAAGGRPIYCNAANLAFDKDLFLSYADPLSVSVPSGDDTLFMLRVKEDSSSPDCADEIICRHCNYEGMRQISGQFFNQRSRWASKSRHYTDRDILYTAGLVLGSFTGFGIFRACNWQWGKIYGCFRLLLLSKSSVDYLFLQRFFAFLRQKNSSLCYSWLFETVYPVYILVSAAMGLFGRYTLERKGTMGRQEFNFPVRR